MKQRYEREKKREKEAKVKKIEKEDSGRKVNNRTTREKEKF